MTYNKYIVCSTYQVRIYNATPNTNNDEYCTVGDTFADYVRYVNICIYGRAYTCDDNGLFEWYFNDPSRGVFDLECTAENPFAIYRIWGEGCDSLGEYYLVTQECSKGITYSIKIISIFSSLFYIIMSFINSL